MEMRESPEDYLEAILVLSHEKGEVHSIDVAAQLGFSKPSVSVAMKKLRENGYVRMEADGRLFLTELGRNVAEKVYDRHQTISGFLMELGVEQSMALHDACKIEHVLSEDTYQRLKSFYQKMEK